MCVTEVREIEVEVIEVRLTRGRAIETLLAVERAFASGRPVRVRMGNDEVSVEVEVVGVGTGNQGIEYGSQGDEQ